MLQRRLLSSSLAGLLVVFGLTWVSSSTAQAQSEQDCQEADCGDEYQDAADTEADQSASWEADADGDSAGEFANESAPEPEDQPYAASAGEFANESEPEPTPEDQPFAAEPEADVGSDVVASSTEAGDAEREETVAPPSQTQPRLSETGEKLVWFDRGCGWQLVEESSPLIKKGMTTYPQDALPPGSRVHAADSAGVLCALGKLNEIDDGQTWSAVRSF